MVICEKRTKLNCNYYRLSTFFNSILKTLLQPKFLFSILFIKFLFNQLQQFLLLFSIQYYTTLLSFLIVFYFNVFTLFFNSPLYRIYNAFLIFLLKKIDLFFPKGLQKLGFSLFDFYWFTNFFTIIGFLAFCMNFWDMSTQSTPRLKSFSTKFTLIFFLDFHRIDNSLVSINI